MNFNGHRSKAAHEVFLHLTRDEQMFNACLAEIEHASGNCRKAADNMISWLPECTPSGYSYSKSSVAETLTLIKENNV